MSAATETKQDLIQRLRGLEPQLRAYGIRRLSLFGSFARGNQHKTSDVDLLHRAQEAQDVVAAD